MGKKLPLSIISFASVACTSLLFQNCTPSSIASSEKSETSSVQSKTSERSPANVQEGIPAKLEGTVELFYEDYADGTHRLRHILKSKQGDRYELHLSSPLEKRLRNRPVSINGFLAPRKQKSSISADLVVSNSSQDIQVLADGNSSFDANFAAAEIDSAISKGEQKTLAILINFQDDPNNKPWTPGTIHDLVFASASSVNKYMQENSSGQTWMTGTVTNWYTIALNSTDCDGFAISNLAKAAAQADGHDTVSYARTIFLFPKNSGCGYSGMAQVGARPSLAWINGAANLHTVSHEFGHNLGAQHAKAKDCGDVVLASSCTIQQYGDTLDVMGYNGIVGHLNMVTKERLGWTTVGHILNVSASGDYLIAPNSLQTTGPKALRIYAGTDASTSLPYYYYAEFRQPIGFDSMLPDRGILDVSNIFGGITIREARTSVNGTTESFLLDLTPGTNFLDMKDAALKVGNSYVDAAAGVTITTISADSNGSLVRVQLNPNSPPPPSADTTAPVVNITNPLNGANVSGTVTISANATDNVGVSKVEFHIDGVLLGSDTSSPYAMNLSSSSLSNSTHTLTAKAYDNANNMSSSMVTFSINNVIPDTTSPILTITSPTNGSIIDPKTSVTIQASASDNIKVNRVDFYVNNSLVCSDTSAPYSCVYKLSASRGVTYGIKAIAYDDADNNSTHEISIISKGTSNGRK